MATGSDLAHVKLDRDSSQRLKQHLAALEAEHGLSQLQRVEVSVLRLERLNQHVLATLQKLLGAVQRPGGGSP